MFAGRIVIDGSLSIEHVAALVSTYDIGANGPHQILNLVPTHTWIQKKYRAATIRLTWLGLAAALSFASVAFAQQARPVEVKTYVSSQDAEGLTQASFTLEFLKGIEAYTVERVRVKAAEYLASVGKAGQKVALSAESTYLEIGSKKLIVIRITDGSGNTSVTIGGLIGQEFKRVLCTKTTPGAPSISYGPCGQKVSEVFGVKL